MLRDAKKPVEGLYPVLIDPQTGEFSSELITIGGLADSYLF